MPYNSYEDGRQTPDLRDDFECCDPGVIAITDGRLGLDKYSDNDADDADADYNMIHHRRNTRSLPSAPDPYYKRKPL